MAKKKRPPDPQPLTPEQVNERKSLLRSSVLKHHDEFLKGLQHAVDTVNVTDKFKTVGIELANVFVTTQLKKRLDTSGLGEPVSNAIQQKLQTEQRQKLNESWNELLGGDERIASAVCYIRQAALVRAWASLEAMAEDVWIETLNTANRTLRDKCFGAVVSAKDDDGSSFIPGLATRQISFGELQRYGFDLSKHLGDFLGRKCSFKTVDNIEASYRNAFSWTNDPPKFHSYHALRRVEFLRHCIVHRGGFVDEELANKLTKEGFRVGKQLEMSGKDAEEAIILVILEGMNFLYHLNQLLEKHDPTFQRIV